MASVAALARRVLQLHAALLEGGFERSRIGLVGIDQRDGPAFFEADRGALDAVDAIEGVVGRPSATFAIEPNDGDLELLQLVDRLLRRWLNAERATRHGLELVVKPLDDLFRLRPRKSL